MSSIKRVDLISMWLYLGLNSNALYAYSIRQIKVKTTLGLLVVTVPQGSAGPACTSGMIPSYEHHGEFLSLKSQDISSRTY